MGVSQPAVLTRGDQTIGGTKTFNGPAINLPPGAVASHLGFTPVQQGTGTGQLNNVVKIGWNGSALALQVDAVNMGTQWPITATGSFSQNSVGAYTFAGNTGPDVGAGATTAGSNIGMTGTWRNMNPSTIFNGSGGLFLRIA